VTDRAEPPCAPRRPYGSDELMAECMGIAAMIHDKDLARFNPDSTMQTAGLLWKWARHRDQLAEIRRLGT
jgi:hypothetical protein